MALQYRSQLNRNRVKWAWFFLTPMLIALFAVAFWPLATTFFYSLFDVQTAKLDDREFVGLANYYDILTDPDWWNAVKNTFIFAISSVSLELIFGMIVALMLHQNFKGRGWMRAAILIPWALPTVVSAKMWRWIMDSQNGILNDILINKLHLHHLFSFIPETINWIGDPTWSMIGIIGIDTWKTVPFMALLLLAALQTVPEDMYEAAKVDGISKWHQFCYLTLPMIKPALIVALIFRTLDALRVYDLIAVFTSGSKATQSISVYAQNQLIPFGYFGEGSAASILVFILVSIIAVVYLWIGRVNLNSGGK